jgi:hypothetical protein
MKSWIRLFSPARNIDSLIAAGLGFFIIHLYSRHSGVGISPDSVTYLSVARNLHYGGGFIAFDRMPLVQFPVLYPMFLQFIFFLTHLDPVVFAPFMNGLLFALLIYCCGSLMNGFSFPSNWYKRILLTCFVLSPCLLEVYSMLWSEGLFLVLTLLFFAGFQYASRARTIGSLLAISVITALCCLTRYAGVSLIGTGALLLLLDFNIRPLKRILRSGIFCVISISPLAINLARNVIESGTMTGIRQKGTTPFMQNLYYFGNTLCDWLPLIKDNHAIAQIIAIACITLLIGRTLIILARRKDQLSIENISAFFGLIYSAFILLSATITRYQQLDSRLLSSLFIPLVWALSCWIPPLIKKLSPRKRIWLVLPAIALFCAFQYNQLNADYETYDGVRDAGVPGYTEDPWPKSPIVNFIKKNVADFLPGYAIYSNAGDAVYFFTGISCDLLPEKVFPVEVKQFYEEQQHYLIWFNDVDNPDMISLQDILLHKKMVCIRQLEDGAVYIYNR